MSFASKFGGKCSKCAGYIAAGSLVNYDGSSIRHAPRCPRAGTVTEVAAPPAKKYDDTVTDDTKIVGRAAYKGKDGYLVLFDGPTSRGRGVKLAFRDGSKTFWADVSVTQITKYYESDRRHGQMTFGRLNRLAKEFAAEKEQAKAGESVVSMLRSQGADLKEAHEEGKNAVRVGQIITRTSRPAGVGVRMEVVAVKASYYVSQDMLDDMDDYSSQPGWVTPYTYRIIESTPEQVAADRAAHEAREQAVRDAAAAKAAAEQAERDVETAHRSTIERLSAGLVRLAGQYAQAGASLSSWTKGSDYSHLSAAVATIDGTPALHLSYGGYDDYRVDTFVSPATRDLIFASRLNDELARKGMTRADAVGYHREQAAQYGGCYGGEYHQWVASQEVA